MSDTTQILLCGLGGQGVVLAGSLLGTAGFEDGMQVSGTSSYGAAARGGECRSEVILSDGPISFPFITRANVLVALSQSAYDRYISWTADPDGVAFYDPAVVVPAESARQRHVPIPASEAAEKLLGTKLGANIVMLAAVVAETSLVKQETLARVVSEGSPARFKEANLKAVKLGAELVQEGA